MRVTTLAHRSVTSATIRDGTIRTVDVRDGAVTAPTVYDRSLARKDFASGQLPAGATLIRLASGPPAQYPMGGGIFALWDCDITRGKAGGEYHKMGNLVFAAGAGSFYTLATGQQFHADTIEPVSDAPNLDLPVGAEGTTLLGVRFTGTVTHTGTEASVWVDANISDDPDRNACSGSLVYLPLKVSS